MAIRFGRYTDSNKPQHKIDKWNESDKSFTDKDYLKSYLAFFDYLRDDTENNVKFWEESGKVKFEILQGSKCVRGTADGERVEVEANIAQMDKPSVAVMRRLLERNFTLNYSRFALRDNVLTLRFDASIAGGQPRKLYYALKEVAIQADTQDDLLVQEFSSLKSVDTVQVEETPTAEKEAKYNYLVKWIQDTLKRAGELDGQKNNGAISWLLLALVYRIDYCLLPQGKLMNDLEKIHGLYYAKDNKPYPQKNSEIQAMLEKLVSQPKENVIRDLYRVKNTFAVTQPSGPDKVTYAVNDATGSYFWWRDNNFADVCIACAEHAASYTLFNYSVPPPVHELFQVLLQIIHPEFFKEMGAEGDYFNSAAKSFNTQAINDKVYEIIERGKAKYPALQFKIHNLKYSNLIDFCYSYLMEMKEMSENFNKPK